MDKIKFFAEELREELLEEMETLKDIRVKTVVKNCAVEKVALVFNDTISNICPVIYVEPYYEEYLEKKEMDISSIARKVRKQYESASLMNEFDISVITDWNKARKNVSYRLVNCENNQKFLEDVPHVKWMDLAIVFYVYLDECNGSVLI